MGPCKWAFVANAVAGPTSKVPVVGTCAFLEMFAGNGPLTLADGLRGDYDIHNKKWIGYNGDNCTLELNLGKKKDISKIKIGYLSNPNSWIFPPKYIKVSPITKDGKTRTECEWGTADLTKEESQIYIGTVEIKCKVKNVEKIKIVVEGIGICPEWHDGKGKKAWLFLDEVWVE